MFPFEIKNKDVMSDCVNVTSHDIKKLLSNVPTCELFVFATGSVCLNPAYQKYKLSAWERWFYGGFTMFPTTVKLKMD